MRTTHFCWDSEVWWLLMELMLYVFSLCKMTCWSIMTHHCSIKDKLCKHMCLCQTCYVLVQGRIPCIGTQFILMCCIKDQWIISKWDKASFCHTTLKLVPHMVWAWVIWNISLCHLDMNLCHLRYQFTPHRITVCATLGSRCSGMRCILPAVV